jgi:hypothetical protein
VDPGVGAPSSCTGDDTASANMSWPPRRDNAYGAPSPHGLRLLGVMDAAVDDDVAQIMGQLCG